MTHPTPQDLAQTVRKGTLDDVLALLDAGLGRERPAELGLGLAMASFLGRREIVRELVRRGAPLNLPNGLTDASPIAMAVKGRQTKTVRLLISYGATIPPGLETGLTHEEFAEALAKAKARRHAAKRAKEKSALHPSAPAAETKTALSASAGPGPVSPVAASAAAAPSAPTLELPDPESQPAAMAVANPPTDLAPLEFSHTPSPRAQPPSRRELGSIVEEIEIEACFGLDTNVLETDLARLGLIDGTTDLPTQDHMPSPGKG